LSKVAGKATGAGAMLVLLRSRMGNEFQVDCGPTVELPGAAPCWAPLSFMPDVPIVRPAVKRETLHEDCAT
jgi:hypothetical protein